jgi:hypothetical protein
MSNTQVEVFDSVSSFKLSIWQVLRIKWWSVLENERWETLTELREKGMTTYAAFQNAVE